MPRQNIKDPILNSLEVKFAIAQRKTDKYLEAYLEAFKVERELEDKINYRKQYYCEIVSNNN